MSDLTLFVPGSFIHIFSVATCVVISLGIAFFGKMWRPDDRCLRAGIALGCLAVSVASIGYWLQPSYFRWNQSLPLHFCNLANFIAAYAIWKKSRPAQSLLYFWTFGLCIWAFITPSLMEGPAFIWFWLFWLYHLFILITATYLLIVDRFRPTWKDYWQSLVITLGYMAILIVLNAITGWDYGFVGPGMPLQPSLLHQLGPYPIRLFWTALLGIVLFALLMLPFLKRGKGKQMP